MNQTNLLIKQDVLSINKYLKKNLPDKILYSKVLWESINYSLLAKGKRIRAILFINVLKAAGIKTVNFLSFAAAIEALHCYTLIHDDLPALDDDGMRRNKPSNHKVFGEATAILAGDALLTLCFDWASKTLPITPANQLKMINRLATLSGYQGLISGQQADLSSANLKSPKEKPEMLSFIHDYKTVALMVASVETAAIAADIDKTQKKLLIKFAKNFGRCFQILDDLADYKQDKQANNKKLTYLEVYGILKSKQAAKQNLKNIKDIVAKLPISYRFFLDLSASLFKKT